MSQVNFLRAAIRVLMVLTLGAVWLWPELFPQLAAIGVWLVPIWIAALFAVQVVTTPDSRGTTVLEVWGNRICGRRWTCPRCGSQHPLDVLLCDDCGELRPDPAAQGHPWVCEVCETENAPEARVCRQCTVPPPE